MDETDTLLAYENKGRTEPFGEDLLTSCLSSLDHIQQLEMIYREDGGPGVHPDTGEEDTMLRANHISLTIQD